MKRFISVVLVLISCSFISFAQNGENIVILWDVTGSLLPKDAGTKDLDGSKIPTYAQGNGMWISLKEAVIDCIEYAEEDPGNKITIVTFNDNIRDIYSQQASSTGKIALVNFVKNYKYKGHKYTNIVTPVTKFYSLLDETKINYMFLFTDGENDQPATKAQLVPTLDSWTGKTNNTNAYGFYVLVHPDADKAAIRKSVERQDNFWMVKDAQVRIKICSFPPYVKYNVRDEKGPKAINMKGKFYGAKGNVELTTDDEYYDISCSDLAINNGKLDIEVRPKPGVTPPAQHELILSPVISEADQYTFVGPKEIILAVSNLPERNLDLIIDNKDFGDASYYDSFLISKEYSKPAISTVKVNFSDQAKAENCSAIMRIYFVDKKGEGKFSPASQNLKILINDEELQGDTYRLASDVTNLSITIYGKPDTKSGTYYGRIELIPNNLDNYSINGEQSSLKWKVGYKYKWNPLKVGLAWILTILVAGLLLWMLVLCSRVFPRFGSIQKTFSIPGMAPLIIKFKGARMVVVSALPQKKQSGWNRFWTGRIIYKTHPAFITPIVFKPCGRRVIAKDQTGSYQIMPNPMPGIGPAIINDIKNNRKITVN